MKANPVASLEAVENPGDWCLGEDTNGHAILFWQCCNCNGFHAVHLQVPGKPLLETMYWQWDQNREQPSVTPSIWVHCNPEPGWHGYMTKGEWITCP